jgi:hypothetical protein
VRITEPGVFDDCNRLRIEANLFACEVSVAALEDVTVCFPWFATASHFPQLENAKPSGW